MLSAANVLACDVRSALRVFGRADSISIAEQPLFGAINLRLNPRDTAALDRVQQSLAIGLPLTPNWVAAHGVTVVWQAFDEWLLLTADGAQDEMAERLLAALADHRAAITDVSDLRANFEIKGPHSRDLLAKGCAVDLHPRVFKTGDCALTALARVRVTLRLIGEAPAYQVLVERSYAQYLWDWLTDAALEFVGSA